MHFIIYFGFISNRRLADLLENDMDLIRKRYQAGSEQTWAAPCWASPFPTPQHMRESKAVP
jgi:hypothetical protein